jgi:hypothetical protein
VVGLLDDVEDRDLSMRTLVALFYLHKDKGVLFKLSKRRGTYTAIAKGRDRQGKSPPEFIQEMMDRICPGLSKMVKSLNIQKEDIYADDEDRR